MEHKGVTFFLSHKPDLIGSLGLLKYTPNFHNGVSFIPKLIFGV